jgi:hypothetical protein
MKPPKGRFAPIESSGRGFHAALGVPGRRKPDQLIDTFDKLKTIIDPTSQYSDVAAAAVNREWDDRIIGAAFATASIGQDAGGLSTETFSPRRGRSHRPSARRPPPASRSRR